MRFLFLMLLIMPDQRLIRALNFQKTMVDDNNWSFTNEVKISALNSASIFILYYSDISMLTCGNTRILIL